MKIFSKALKVLLCASLACSIGLSATACNVDENDNPPGTIETPGGTEENPGGNTGNNPSNPGTTPGGDNTDDNENPPVVQPEKKTYTVTFNSKGGSAVSAQTVEMGAKASKPTNPTLAENLFQGWYTDENCKNAYSFDSAVNANITLYAKWSKLDANIKSVKQYCESMQVTWAEGDAANAVVSYKESDGGNWITVDKNLVSAPAAGEATVNIVGLKAASYDIKIKTGDSKITQNGIAIEAYDRSGYAHFNYSDGVGAYNDDGTLKDGALVIYVTDANKNDVREYAYKNTANGLVKEDISQYIKPTESGVNYGSIGYILNNRAFAGNDRWNYGISKLTFSYPAVAVRIVGKVNAEDPDDETVSLINGLTAYNSKENGGSVGDNGRMARMVNAKNLTIEGVGETASIHGWGIHFIASDPTATKKFPGAGVGFEVRNITFKNYPEDAIGMEGVQGTKWNEATNEASGKDSATSDLLSPVERCWIHDNTFLPGYCKKPAQSDKAEGDGSCDFKRGQYYTLSYNYFELCHKTNLIGSKDGSLAFNISMHHNWWNNCGSRQPLLRRANVHFYNNYISTDGSEAAKEQGGALSYVSSLRADSYMFSEANYYEACKNVTKGDEGGVGKAYGNIYMACTDANSLVEATARDQYVTNNCKFSYRNIDYSHFDTDSSLFYYDATNKKSDCFLQSAVDARVTVMQTAGANGFGDKFTGYAMNKHTPSTAVQVSSDGVTEIALPSKKTSEDFEISGVLFRGITGVSSGTVKGKGQIVTFTLASEAEVTIVANAKEGAYPDLVDSTGIVHASKFSSLKTVLNAGTYFVVTSGKEKEATIGKISFADTAASSAARLEAVTTAVAALPESITSDEHVDLVAAAERALAALTSTERAKFESENAAAVNKLNSAKISCDNYRVNKVIALIDGIGAVTEESYEKISAANDAYIALGATLQSRVTNRSTLANALTAYANLAVKTVIDEINALTDVSAWTSDKTEAEINGALSAYNAVKVKYDALTAEDDPDGNEAQQPQVTNSDKLLNGLTKLNALKSELAAKAVKAKIDALTDVSGWTSENKLLPEVNEALNAYATVITEYDALPSAQKALVTNANKLTQGKAALDALKTELETIAANEAKLAAFRDALAAIDETDLTVYTYQQLTPVVEKYKALEDLTSELTSEEAAKYAAIKTKYDELALTAVKTEAISAADYTSATSKIEGTLATVTFDGSFISKTVSSAATAGDKSFTSMLLASSNKKGFTIASGNEAIKLTLYVNCADSSYGSGKTCNLSLTDMNGNRTVSVNAGKTLTNVDVIEVVLDKNSSCAITYDNARLALFHIDITTALN